MIIVNREILFPCLFSFFKRPSQKNDVRVQGCVFRRVFLVSAQFSEKHVSQRLHTL